MREREGGGGGGRERERERERGGGGGRQTDRQTDVDSKCRNGKEHKKYHTGSITGDKSVLITGMNAQESAGPHTVKR